MDAGPVSETSRLSWGLTGQGFSAITLVGWDWIRDWEIRLYCAIRTESIEVISQLRGIIFRELYASRSRSPKSPRHLYISQLGSGIVSMLRRKLFLYRVSKQNWGHSYREDSGLGFMIWQRIYLIVETDSRKRWTLISEEEADQFVRVLPDRCLSLGHFCVHTIVGPFAFWAFQHHCLLLEFCVGGILLKTGRNRCFRLGWVYGPRDL